MPKVCLASRPGRKLHELRKEGREIPTNVGELERLLGTWRQYKSEHEAGDGASSGGVPLGHVGPKGQPCPLAGAPVGKNTRWGVVVGGPERQGCWGGTCSQGALRGGARTGYSPARAVPFLSDGRPVCLSERAASWRLQVPCHAQGLQVLLRQEPEARLRRFDSRTRCKYLQRSCGSSIAGSQVRYEAVKSIGRHRLCAGNESRMGGGRV